jgi:5-methylcytosine-specific restriction enzyme subunit McrC
MTQTIEVGEYQSARAPASPPSKNDCLLADRLSRGSEDTEARLTVRWLAGGDVEVTASSWVGVVRFSELEIKVVPKFVGGALRVLRMLEYAGGVNLLRRLPADRALPVKGDDLFDLVCLLLVEETLVLVRDGPLSDYREVNEGIDVMRGRLRYREQYLRRFGQLDVLECSFDEYDSDIPENQLLAAALNVARRRASEPAVRFGALRLAGVLSAVCHPTTDAPDWYERNIVYSRRNTRYRSAHELAKLVLRSAAFNDMYDTGGRGTTQVFLLNMNTIFERFVTRLVSEALDGTTLNVKAQDRYSAAIYDDANHRSYSTIKPDLVVEDSVTRQAIPIDIKYKLYGAKKLSTGDIYQTFMYAFALGSSDVERRAGLIYPADSSRSGPALSIRPIEGPIAARITGAGLDVPAALDALGTGIERARVMQQVRQLVASIAGINELGLQGSFASKPSTLRAPIS